jgi:hypothetical protein
MHTARDLSGLFARIGSLFERGHRPGTSGATDRPTRAEVEELLKEGYAEALALELELATIERRIADLFSGGRSTAEASPARELRTLGARRLSREHEIVGLRSLLGELREYGDSLPNTGLQSGRLPLQW